MTTSGCIAPCSFVTLHYRLSGAVGDVINTFGGAPATFTLGSGALAPVLEAQLLGLTEGSHAVFDLAPGAVFGVRNADLLQWLSRETLSTQGDDDAQYEIGDVVQFPTPDGQGAFAGSVRAHRQDERGAAVLLDFNHPLAGQGVRFEVQVIGVL